MGITPILSLLRVHMAAWVGHSVGYMRRCESSQVIGSHLWHFTNRQAVEAIRANGLMTGGPRRARAETHLWDVSGRHAVRERANRHPQWTHIVFEGSYRRHRQRHPSTGDRCWCCRHRARRSSSARSPARARPVLLEPYLMT